MPFPRRDARRGDRHMPSNLPLRALGAFVFGLLGRWQLIGFLSIQRPGLKEDTVIAWGSTGFFALA